MEKNEFLNEYINYNNKITNTMKQYSLTTQLVNRTSLALLQELILESDYEGYICCTIQEGDFSIYKEIFRQLVDNNKIKIYDIIDNRIVYVKVEKFRISNRNI